MSKLIRNKKILIVEFYCLKILRNVARIFTLEEQQEKKNELQMEVNWKQEIIEGEKKETKRNEWKRKERAKLARW